ncbi:hypothetical protein [Microbacterium sp. APC 3901]|uniref:hypothetical protein n=1 Tax=Microbacterium sp. APC 3901 TaxID=3035192 RepID=UPI0025B5C320|nr:hypothetical protein [Microbacterium sp. APC 3901]MDN3443751.1 hypothetical protein [Microbacterium sp. APC 3901]
MSNRRAARDLDARAWEYLDANVNESAEISHLRAGWDPPWERPSLNGEDVTDRPELWTPYQRARREAFEARLVRYRAENLIT